MSKFLKVLDWLRDLDWPLKIVEDGKSYHTFHFKDKGKLYYCTSHQYNLVDLMKRYDWNLVEPYYVIVHKPDGMLARVYDESK